MSERRAPHEERSAVRKHAGKLRGWAHIEVVVVGGWKKYGPGERNGRVVRPGQVLAVNISDFNGRRYLEVGS